MFVWGFFLKLIDPKVSSRIVIRLFEEGNHKLSLFRVFVRLFSGCFLGSFGYQLAVTASCSRDLRPFAELLQNLRL